MKKYFKSIEEQIDILEKRGLEIKDKDLAKKSLLRYNYYKLINSTIKFFRDENFKEVKYKSGTDFQDLLDVHNFDKNIKKILLSSALEIERIARSIISYKFVEKYPMENAYLDYKSFNKEDKNLVELNIESIKETISKYELEENFKRSMSYYKEKYGSIPFWFVINFVSFGKLVNIYETLDLKLREDIADEFKLFLEENVNKELNNHLTPKQLLSFLNAAKEIRNICAHDNLILDHKFEEIEFLADVYKDTQSNHRRIRLFDAIITFKSLLPKDSYDLLWSQLAKEIELLRENVSEDVYELILESIGYKKY